MKYILAFLFFYTLGAQAGNSSLIQNDSTNFVNKATEGIPKLLYAFMEDYKSTFENYGEGEIHVNEKDGMELFNSKFIDGYENFDNPAELLDSIDLFLAKKENGWSSQGYTIFQSLKENYESEISSASYNLNTILDIGDKTKIYIKKLDQFKNDQINWNEASNIFYANESKLEVEEVRENQVNSIETDLNDPSSSGDRQEVSSENNYSYIYNYLTYFGVFVFGFLCAIIFFNYKIQKILNEEFDEYKRIYRENHRGFSLIRFDVIKILKERKEKYKKEAELKPTPKLESKSRNKIPEWRQKQLEDTQYQNKSPHNAPEPFEEKIAPTFDLEVGSNQKLSEISRNEKKVNSIYFSAPEQSGIFLLENSSSSATSRSYYKIEYVEDENMGKLIYRSGNLDMSALSQMDFILSPVCDIENSSMANPTVIYVEADGKVIREGDSWKIDQKIKIRLS